MLYTYISHSRMPKTYYGVTFHYGDKKEVSGIIRDNRFVFCCSRQNPPTPTKTQVVENDLPKKVEESPELIAETVPVEKPKTTRRRRPKVATTVLDELTSEESNSGDTE